MKPILFSTPMVQAILKGRKTQTRRIVSPQPDDSGLWNDDKYPRSLDSDLKGWNGTVLETGESKQFKCKYGSVGDILWVRETWKHHGRPDISNVKFIYKADKTNSIGEIIKWKPSLFMPKEACRLFLKITNVRVERLINITVKDAIAEGIEIIHYAEPGLPGLPVYQNYLLKQKLGTVNPCKSYATLWDSINGSGAWMTNPFVWIIEFERCERPEGWI